MALDIYASDDDALQGMLQRYHHQESSATAALVIADRVEELGDADRAEFIRAQCRLQENIDDSERTQLKAREKKLLETHIREWVPPTLREVITADIDFCHGLIYRKRLSANRAVALFNAAMDAGDETTALLLLDTPAAAKAIVSAALPYPRDKLLLERIEQTLEANDEKGISLRLLQKMLQTQKGLSGLSSRVFSVAMRKMRSDPKYMDVFIDTGVLPSLDYALNIGINYNWPFALIQDMVERGAKSSKETRVYSDGIGHVDAFHFALAHRRFDIAELLWEKAPQEIDPNIIKYMYLPEQKLIWLVERGMKLDFDSPALDHSSNFLEYAVCRDMPKLVEAILAREDGRALARTEDGIFSLMELAVQPHANDMGRANSPNLKIIRALRQAGAKDPKDIDWDHAIANPALIKEFGWQLRKGMRPEQLSHLLFTAAENGNCEMAEALLKHGAYARMTRWEEGQDGKEITASQVAEKAGHKELAQRLKAWEEAEIAAMEERNRLMEGAWAAKAKDRKPRVR